MKEKRRKEKGKPKTTNKKGKKESKKRKAFKKTTNKKGKKGK